MRELVTWPNLMTSGNLAAGFLALVAVSHDIRIALVLVISAAVFDSLDGFIARRTGAEGTFGANLDSLSDLVSFGVVPAMALYYGKVDQLPVIGLFGALAFVLCGGWRLARFPLVKTSHSFVGLPIPPTGIAAIALALWAPSPLIALVAAAALSALMISAVPFPTLAMCARGAATVKDRSSRLLPHR
ncbi:MAG: CDP-diacylglycerol---serine O-phosphatidyltransferase [Frankiaceae bacterium]|jgi:CDP-diacylglycerol--serine O-phosphatidyltransferase|nr:CDP-diacylglycerol---serine O-phosphatidyltransferase [Frankiaceae bacterium]MDQ1674102.1 CDP-diacylglycerol---serine O-phosphatidyltransferase [Frankiaceae bacterium]